MAKLSVWEESESGHTINKSTFLFLVWVPTERTAYKSCFKVRVTPVLLLAQKKDDEKCNASEEYKFKHVCLLLAAR